MTTCACGCHLCPAVHGFTEAHPRCLTHDHQEPVCAPCCYSD